MASFTDTLGALWGAPGVADATRTAVASASAGWGIPGDLARLIPAGNASQPPAAPQVVAPSPIANTTKDDAQPEPGFMAKNGRLMLIIGGGLAVVVLLFTLFRRKG